MSDNTPAKPKPSPDPHDLIECAVCSAHASWKLWQQLFGTQEANDLMRIALGPMADDLRFALIDSIILEIVRLTDTSKASLSLKRLLKSLSNKDLDSEFIELRKSTATLLSHRDKRIAHTDHQSATNSGCSLPLLIVQDIEKAVTAVTQFMHKVDECAGRGEVAYEWTEIGPAGDGLILRIKMAEQLEKLAWEVDLGQHDFDSLRDRIRQIVP